METKTPIKSFRDLEVYTSSYTACIAVVTHILPKLPSQEKFDLADQLLRSSKAIPRLIAEGYAKRHQKSGFQKYLDDAMAESNETIVGLEQIKDIYRIEPDLCEKLIDSYNKISRQLFNLATAWHTFKNRRPPTPLDDTGIVTDKL
jgi:four helix bundle protein